MSNDVFPLLDTSELAICLQSCDFSLATEENISRPSSQWVITIYKQIIDSFMGISADLTTNITNNNLTKSEGVAHEDLMEKNGDNMYLDTLEVLVLNKICYRFFENIGVADFNMNDLYKPELQRTKRLLSAVVNYARFREERMFDCNRFISQTEALLGQLRSKFDDFNLLKQQIKQYEEDEKLIRSVVVVDGEDELDALEANNKNMETQLKKLTHLQETLSIDYNSYKQEKQKLLKELELFGFQIVELESQKEKLKKYSETNLEELDQSIEELLELLNTNKTKLFELRKSQESYNISKVTFQRIIDELYDVLRIVSIELQESHRKELALEEHKQQLMMRHDKMSNVLSSSILTKISLLYEQLDNQKKKMKTLVEDSRAESEKNSLQIDELQRKYAEDIIPEIQETEARIERDILSVEVKDLEDKINQLQIEFQREIDAVELEYSLLVGHINKYIKMMVQNIN